jgi:hypothetical protein
MPCLPASVHSLGTRLLLSLHIHVTSNPPFGMGVVIRGDDSSFQSQLQAKLVELQGELSLGTAGYAWRGMNLTMQLLAEGDEDTPVSNATSSTTRLLDALIHPRLPPPTLRKLPAPETLMLFGYEESAEEREERVSLRLDDGTGLGMDVEVRKVTMGDGHLPVQEEDIRSKNIENEDRGDGIHAMEVEITPPKSTLTPTAAQSAPWPQEHAFTSTELTGQSDEVTQRPMSLSGFGVNPTIFEEGASSVPQAAVITKPPVDTGASNPVKAVDFNERQFASMGDMSDEESIPSIDMGSDSE